MSHKAKKVYVDGFVIPVATEKLKEYKKMALEGAKLWIKHGALEYVECVLDDAEPDMQGMPFMPFMKLAKAKEGETVLYSFIIYKSRKHRDKVNEKVMKDPSMSEDCNENTPMPFDMKRMAVGGFESIVHYAK